MISQPTQTALFGYAQKSKDAGLEAASSSQLAVFSCRAFNRSGSAMDVGIVRKYANASMRLYTFDGTNYTSVSLPLDAASQLIGTTNGNGFAVQFKSKSGVLGFTVSQAEAGSPVYEVEYWNGSSWETLTTIESVSAYTADDHYIVFLPPHDWAKGGHADLQSSMYSIRVRATTAPSTAVEIDDLWGGQLIEFIEAVGDNSSVEVEFENDHPLVLEGGESLMPYFGSADAANGMRVAYSNV